MLYYHCLYICCVVQSLQVHTYCMYIHTYCCVHVCMYACLYILYQNIIMQVCTCVLEQYRLVNIVIYAALLRLHVCICKCTHMLMYINFIGTCIHAYMHVHKSYNRCDYFVIRKKKMLKQNAPSTVLLVIVALVSVAG